MENKKLIYNESIGELYSRFETSEYGLNDSDAKKRSLKYTENNYKKKNHFSFGVSNSINILLLVITILTAIISYINSTTYLASIIMFIIVLLNVIFGFYYNNGKKDVKKTINFKYNVFRYGVKKSVDIAQLVPGDIVELNENDRILFDGRIIKCENFEVDESMLAGKKTVIKNSDIINFEKPTDEISNMVFSGSSVINGKATILITNIDFAQMLDKLDFSNKKYSTFHEKLNKTINNLILISYLIIIILFIINIIKKRSLLDVVDLSLLLIIGSIPVGLQIILTIILIYKKKIIEKNGFKIKRLSSILDIVNIDTICFSAIDENTINYCNDIGIRCLILTNKSKEFLSELNIDGIDNNIVLDSSEIEKMTDDEITSAVKTCQLYCNLNYKSKCRIVEALQNNKNIVATLGNNISDFLAVCESNIGITNNNNKIINDVSEFIIGDDIFNIVKLLKECKKVSLLINKVLSYLVSESLLEMIILFISLVLNIRIINIMQLLWIKIINIPLSIMMIYENENIFSYRLNNFKRKVILYNSIVIGIVMILLYIYNVSLLNIDSASSLLFISLIVNSFLSSIFFVGKNIIKNKQIIIFFAMLILVNIIMLTTKLSNLFIVNTFKIYNVLICMMVCVIAFVINKLVELYYRKRELKYEER